MWEEKKKILGLSLDKILTPSTELRETPSFPIFCQNNPDEDFHQTNSIRSDSQVKHLGT